MEHGFFGESVEQGDGFLTLQGHQLHAALCVKQTCASQSSGMLLSGMQNMVLQPAPFQKLQVLWGARGILAWGLLSI